LQGEEADKLLKALTIRPAIESDIPQLVDLMNLQYSRKKDKLYFLWQYFNSHYPTILMCAFNNTKLVGMFGLQKRRLKSGVHVGQAIDLLIAPEWRRQGIFKLLGTEVISYFNDLILFCVFPNLNGKSACERAFGWKTLGKINSMFLYNKNFKNLSEKASMIPYSVKKDYIFEKFDYNDETRIWRFDRHPDYEYTYVKLVTGEFAVTKVFKDPVTGVLYGDIVDFECDLNNQVLLRELFLKANTHLKEQGVEIVTTWALPHTPLREVVESLGFVDTPQERYFCLKILKDEYEYLYDLSRWHLVQADAEIY
jgi:GNAT superfamily N-acetyltransferase